MADKRTQTRVIYLLFGAGGYKFLHNRNYQIKTWVRSVELPSEVIYMCGDSQSDVAYLKNHILYLPISEEYEFALKRQLLALEWVIENRNFDWLIFSNTSNYFNHHRLTDFLANNVGNRVSAVRGIWKDENGDTTVFPSGAGTIMNFAAAKDLSSLPMDQFSEFPNDVGIGKLLSLLNEEINQIDRVDITDWKFYRNHFQYRVKHWRFHRITSYRMLVLDKIDNSNRVTKYLWILLLNLSQVFLNSLSLMSRAVRRLFMNIEDSKS